MGLGFGKRRNGDGIGGEAGCCEEGVETFELVNNAAGDGDLMLAAEGSDEEDGGKYAACSLYK